MGQFTTLPEYFETTFLKVFLIGQQRSPMTIKSYRDTMKHWTRLTPNPPLDQITNVMIAEFSDSLSKRKGKKNPQVTVATIRKHLTNLDYILRSLGKPCRSNKTGQGTLDYEPPFVMMPKAEHHVTKQVFTLEEM